MDYYEHQSAIPVKRYKPEKDATDTRIGLELAIKLGSSRVFLLGATGGRLDHYMGNLQSLTAARMQGVEAWILDSRNALTVLDKPFTLQKEKQFGKYVSFFSMSDKVEGLTLTGFQYPLHEYTMTNFDGIWCSNEIKEETARVEFRNWHGADGDVKRLKMVYSVSGCGFDRALLIIHLLQLGGRIWSREGHEWGDLQKNLPEAFYNFS